MACYYRIASPMAALALKCQGSPHSFSKLMLDAINNMKHYIWTSYGDSTHTYDENTNNKFHGILQGNGDGPFIWAMVSSPLLDILRHEGHGVYVCTSDSDTIHISAFAFVNDVDLIQDLQCGDVNLDPQSALSDWEKSLQVTGGTLVPEKCKYFILKYKWQDNKCTTKWMNKSKYALHIKNEQGILQPIQQIPLTQRESVLGIMFSQSKVEMLCGKAQHWAEKVRTAHLSHQDAWYCLNTTVLKTIEYAIPAPTMSKKDIERSIRPILQIGLPKSWICQKISCHIVFTPLKFQGFRIKHPFVLQGTTNLRIMLSDTNNLTSTLIGTSSHRLILEVGIGHNFLLKNEMAFNLIYTPSWIGSIRQMLSEYRIQVMRRGDQ
jgi:hypothetical protein